MDRLVRDIRTLNSLRSSTNFGYLSDVRDGLFEGPSLIGLAHYKFFKIL